MTGNKEVEKHKKSNCYGPGFRSVWQSCSFFSHLASCQWRPEQGNPASRISLSSNCWTLNWNCPSSLILSHQRRIVRLIIALNKWQVLLYPGAKWLQKDPSAEGDHHHHQSFPRVKVLCYTLYQLPLDTCGWYADGKAAHEHCYEFRSIPL